MKHAGQEDLDLTAAAAEREAVAVEAEVADYAERAAVLLADAVPRGVHPLGCASAEEATAHARAEVAALPAGLAAAVVAAADSLEAAAAAACEDRAGRAAALRLGARALVEGLRATGRPGHTVSEHVHSTCTAFPCVFAARHSTA